jgi:hypothetical protein
MRYTLFSVLRDSILFCALLALLHVAFEENLSFIREHKKSLIHELDRSFIDYLYTAQRQLHILYEHAAYSTEAHATLSSLSTIKDKLTAIEQQYKHNSPGLALLGPIGIASIVIKEEQLQSRLLALINEMSLIIHHIKGTKEDCKPALTVENGLSTNKKLIKTLIT